MRIRLGGVDFSASFWFFALLAVMAAADRGALLRYLLVPIVVHEMGHLVAMGLCRARVAAVRLTALGIEIRRGEDALGYGRELLVSLGGVAANGLLALLLHRFCFHSMRTMFLVAANLAVAIFNLMPIADLDGGQVVRLLCQRFLTPRAAMAISRAASLLVLAALFGFAGFLLLNRLANPSLLVMCGFLACNVMLREG